MAAWDGLGNPTPLVQGASRKPTGMKGKARTCTASDSTRPLSEADFFRNSLKRRLTRQSAPASRIVIYTRAPRLHDGKVHDLATTLQSQNEALGIEKGHVPWQQKVLELCASIASLARLRFDVALGSVSDELFCQVEYLLRTMPLQLTIACNSKGSHNIDNVYTVCIWSGKAHKVFFAHVLSMAGLGAHASF